MDEQHNSELRCRCAAHPQLAAPSRRQSLRTHRRKATNPWGLNKLFQPAVATPLRHGLVPRRRGDGRVYGVMFLSNLTE